MNILGNIIHKKLRIKCTIIKKIFLKRPIFSTSNLNTSRVTKTKTSLIFFNPMICANGAFSFHYVPFSFNQRLWRHNKLDWADFTAHWWDGAGYQGVFGVRMLRRGEFQKSEGDNFHGWHISMKDNVYGRLVSIGDNFHGGMKRWWMRLETRPNINTKWHKEQKKTFLLFL